jgi:hypothetical protein
MRRLVFISAAISLFVFAADGVSAQAKHRVRFARGASGTTVRGTVRGYAYRDYVIGASAGQTIWAKLRSPNTPSVFAIFRPDGENLEGAAELDRFDGELPVSGDYVIRVLMMRSAARRRGSMSNYSLTISIH